MDNQTTALAVISTRYNQVDRCFLDIKSTLCFHREEENGPPCLRPGVFSPDGLTGRYCADHAPDYIIEAAWDIADQWYRLEAACRKLASLGRPVPKLPIIASLAEHYEPPPKDMAFGNYDSPCEDEEEEEDDTDNDGFCKTSSLLVCDSHLND